MREPLSTTLPRRAAIPRTGRSAPPVPRRCGAGLPGALGSCLCRRSGTTSTATLSTRRSGTPTISPPGARAPPPRLGTGSPPVGSGCGSRPISRCGAPTSTPPPCACRASPPAGTPARSGAPWPASASSTGSACARSSPGSRAGCPDADRSRSCAAWSSRTAPWRRSGSAASRSRPRTPGSCAWSRSSARTGCRDAPPRSGWASRSCTTRASSRTSRRRGCPIDVGQWHEYAVRWDEQVAEFSVDGEHVRTCARPPTYPMQVMIAVFDFPDWPGDASVPALEVDWIGGETLTATTSSRASDAASSRRRRPRAAGRCRTSARWCRRARPAAPPRCSRGSSPRRRRPPGPPSPRGSARATPGVRRRAPARRR